MGWTWTQTVQSGCESLEFGPGRDPKKKLNLTRCTFLHFGKHSRTIEISLRIHRINLTAL